MITFGTIAVFAIGAFVVCLGATSPRSPGLERIGTGLTILALGNFMAMAAGFYS